MSTLLAGRPGPELAAAARTPTDALERLRLPDPRSNVARLRDEWGRLERALGAEAARLRRHAERLDDLGVRRLTRSGREDGRQLGVMIERSEQALERLTLQQAATGRELRALGPALERRERWKRDLAPALSGRAEVLEGKIARRVEARLADIEHEPPGYLTKALGAVPELGRGSRATPIGRSGPSPRSVLAPASVARSRARWRMGAPSSATSPERTSDGTGAGRPRVRPRPSPRRRPRDAARPRARAEPRDGPVGAPHPGVLSGLAR